MKRRDLEAWMRKHGCRFLSHGSKHDIWVNPTLNQTAAVPRHAELKTGTGRAVCKELGIPIVPFK